MDVRVADATQSGEGTGVGGKRKQPIMRSNPVLSMIICRLMQSGKGNSGSIRAPGKGAPMLKLRELRDVSARMPAS